MLVSFSAACEIAPTYKNMNLINSVVQPLGKMLTAEDKRKGVVVVLLLTLSALLDFFGVASLLPLIFAVVDPEFFAKNSILQKVYVSGGFNSTGEFIFVLAI